MVNNATINQDVWTSVRAIIVGTMPFITNSSTHATTTVTVVADYNDKGYSRPTIVIPAIRKEEQSDVFGTQQGKKLIHVMVDCYAAQSLGADQIADQVEDLLKTNELSGWNMVAITSEYYTQIINDDKYHVKSIVFTYTTA